MAEERRAPHEVSLPCVEIPDLETNPSVLGDCGETQGRGLFSLTQQGREKWFRKS